MANDAAARLAAAGIAEPRVEARRLRTVAADEDAFERSIVRRVAGEPFAYAAGVAGFRHLDLRADARALIPRPETEGLVELVLARVSEGTAVDVGTGTGCIALSLATEGRFARVLGVDRSAESLSLARENAASVAVASAMPADMRLGFLQADLTSALAAGCCDALVSNPPYLTDAEYDSLDGSVRDWEPALALASGPDGLAATDALLDDGRRVVRPGGWIALEVDCSRAAEAARRADALGWRDVAVYMDLFGRERYLLARRSDA